MSSARPNPGEKPSATPGRRRQRERRASRAETPQACGCGLPVAYDVGKHEFFCIGCGNATECVCRKSLLTAEVRPLNVV